MGDIWADSPEVYAQLDQESRIVIVHPWLRERIGQLQPKNILDFGCGDGLLFKLYAHPYNELCLYDHSVRMVDLARRNFCSSQNNLCFSAQPQDIRRAHYDAIVCSLVLMTVPTEAELHEIAGLIHDSATPDATCLVAVTHPCFLQYPFSTFETEFAREESFDYLNHYGRPFHVRLSDGNRQSFVDITDYHWPLSFILNLFVQTGFDLRSVAELPDCTVNSIAFNHHVPAYLVMEFAVR